MKIEVDVQYNDGIYRESYDIRFPNGQVLHVDEESYNAMTAVREGLKSLDQQRELFPITSLSREDLKGFSDARDAKVDALSDASMEHLASKMANDYLNQLYWGSLEILAHEYVPEVFRDDEESGDLDE